MDDVDMTDSDLVSKMTVVQLKEWLKDHDVEVSSRTKKQGLVNLVVSYSKDKLAASPVKKVSPSSMTIPQLIAWLTEHNIELPSKRQRKQFYVELVEDAAQDVAPKKKAPNTAPSKRASSRSKISGRAASASPVAARRRLIAMPQTDPEDDSAEEFELSSPSSSSSSDSDEGVVSEKAPRSRRSSGTIPGSNLRAFIVVAMVLATIAAYCYWVFVQLEQESPPMQYDTATASVPTPPLSQPSTDTDRPL